MSVVNGRTLDQQTPATDLAYNDILPVSILQSTGKYQSFKMTQQNLTKLRIPNVVIANYTVLPNDDLIKADSTAGIFTITLLSAAGIAGVTKIIKKMNASNNITIACNGSETIDGAATKTLSTQYDSLKVTSDGTNWIISP